jgi:hypothetical protein
MSNGKKPPTDNKSLIVSSPPLQPKQKLSILGVYKVLDKIAASCDLGYWDGDQYEKGDLERFADNVDGLILWKDLRKSKRLDLLRDDRGVRWSHQGEDGRIREFWHSTEVDMYVQDLTNWIARVAADLQSLCPNQDVFDAAPEEIVEEWLGVMISGLNVQLQNPEAFTELLISEVVAQELYPMAIIETAREIFKTGLDDIKNSTHWSKHILTVLAKHQEKWEVADSLFRRWRSGFYQKQTAELIEALQQREQIIDHREKLVYHWHSHGSEHRKEVLQLARSWRSYRRHLRMIEISQCYDTLGNHSVDRLQPGYKPRNRHKEVRRLHRDALIARYKQNKDALTVRQRAYVRTVLIGWMRRSDLSVDKYSDEDSRRSQVKICRQHVTVWRDEHHPNQTHEQIVRDLFEACWMDE